MRIEDENTQPSTKSSNSMTNFPKLDQKQSIQKSSNPKNVLIPNPKMPNQTSEFSIPFNSTILLNPMPLGNSHPISKLLFWCVFLFII